MSSKRALRPPDPAVEFVAGLAQAVGGGEQDVVSPAQMDEAHGRGRRAQTTGLIAGGDVFGGEANACGEFETIRQAPSAIGKHVIGRGLAMGGVFFEV
ncbi:MAG: hypothetical protein J6386_16145 [Candidatus Synoicihabitans palmerolidicus]|nr:hypothetical protein [Candidatus Synoicihabitans palmerolidicus]